MGNTIVNYLKKLSCQDSIIYRYFGGNIKKVALAIQRSDLQTIKQLNEIKKISFFRVIEDGENLFHLAIKSKSLPIIKFILENDQIQQSEYINLLDSRNDQGDSPLMIATLLGDIQIVKYLIQKHQVYINCKDFEGNTPFIAACANGYLEIIQYFISETNVKVSQKNNDGQTGIHRAAYYGQIQTIRFLLKNTQLNLLQVDKFGNNCFHYAAMRFNMSCIRYMKKKLKMNYDKLLYSKNSLNFTPMDYLVRGFNLIVYEDQEKVTENEVMQYIVNKECPPIILKNDQNINLKNNQYKQASVKNQQQRKSFCFVKRQIMLNDNQSQNSNRQEQQQLLPEDDLGVVNNPKEDDYNHNSQQMLLQQCVDQFQIKQQNKKKDLVNIDLKSRFLKKDKKSSAEINGEEIFSAHAL